MTCYPVQLSLIPRAGALAVSLALSWLSPTLTAASEPVAARVELHPATVYAGEQFELHIAIQSRGVQIGHDFRLIGLPEGDRIERLGAFEELPIARTQQDGIVTETRRYRVRARAPAPGTVTVGPVLELSIVRRRAMGWGSVRETTRQQVAVAPAELTVHPLPPVPEGLHFSGAIGSFALSVDATPRELAPGDLLNVRTRITGDGPLEPIEPPRIDEAPGFQRYAPRRLETDQGALFEQILIPRTTNAVALPPVTFTYFDPRLDAYRTARSESVRLTFRPETVTEIDIFRPEPAGDTAPLADARESGIARMREADRGARLDLPIRRAAHIAPGELALLVFELPAGTRVRVLDRHADWLRIAAGRKRGWIHVP